MPLLAGTSVVIPDPDGGPGNPVQELDIPKATWVDPRGNEWPLTQPDAYPWFTTRGVSGINSASPLSITSDDQPRGGTTVRHIQPGSRSIVWPLLVEGPTHSQFLQHYRELMRAFTMTRRYGPGRLIISRPDGTSREIDAYYQEGWADTPEGSMRWELVALMLYCPSPFWRGRTAVRDQRTYQGSQLPSYLSIFPQVATARSLGQRSTVVNPGDVEAWPTWTIRGPMESVQAINHTLARSWSLSATAFRGSPLALGETVTVTTDPARVIGPAIDGYTGWAGALNWPGAELWPVDEGENDVEYIAVGGGAGSEIELSFLPRYESG